MPVIHDRPLHSDVGVLLEEFAGEVLPGDKVVLTPSWDARSQLVKRLDLGAYSLALFIPPKHPELNTLADSELFVIGDLAQILLPAQVLKVDRDWGHCAHQQFRYVSYPSSDLRVEFVVDLHWDSNVRAFFLDGSRGKETVKVPLRASQGPWLTARWYAFLSPASMPCPFTPTSSEEII